jgi:hypothetical protein
MKRILMAGGVALYLNKGEVLIDSLLVNPMVAGLGVSTQDGMIDIELLRDILKKEVSKVGYMRVTFPFVGDIDFTIEDIDNLYGYISGSGTQSTPTIYPVRTQEVY